MHRAISSLPVLTLLYFGTAFAADVCSDFDTPGSLDGWTAEAATVTSSVPGPAGTPYLLCGDQSSPPYSAIIAPSSYLGSWLEVGALTFDLVLHNDGWPDEAHALSPVLHLKASVLEDVGERAVFIVDTPISDPDGPDSGWHHIVAPVHLAVGSLPANASGHWVVPQPIVNPVTDWNNLLENVQLFRFIADIAGSPTQLESFGLDNVCRVDQGTVSVEETSWGRIKSEYR
ncbi:MAG: hypothetical protein R3B81_06130 [bacterium]